MSRALDDVIKGLPLDQQQEIEAQAARLIDRQGIMQGLR
jgi:adenylate kinase